MSEECPVIDNEVSVMKEITEPECRAIIPLVLSEPDRKERLELLRIIAKRSTHLSDVRNALRNRTQLSTLQMSELLAPSLKESILAVNEMSDKVTEISAVLAVLEHGLKVTEMTKQTTLELVMKVQRMTFHLNAILPVAIPLGEVEGGTSAPSGTQAEAQSEASGPPPQATMARSRSRSPPASMRTGAPPWREKQVGKPDLSRTT